MTDFVTRLLTAADTDLLDAFLAPHTPYAYFLRSNATKGGLDYKGDAYQAEYFGAFDNGALVGVAAHSWLGNIQLFCVNPLCIPSLAAALHDHRARYLRNICALLGVAAQVDALCDAVGLKAEAFRDGKEDERLFALDLAAMIEPTLLTDPAFNLRRAGMSDFDLITQWRHDFLVEAAGDEVGEKTMNRAREEHRRRIPNDEIYLLEHKGQPVSYCGIGGFLPDVTNVGPVWTPPHCRNRGFGRAVVAGGLKLLRAQGIEKAVLFAVKPEAVKAYRALGFNDIAAWRLGYLVTPVDRL